MYGATTLVDDQFFPQFDAAYKISERYNVHPDFRVDRS